MAEFTMRAGRDSERTTFYHHDNRSDDRVVKFKGNRSRRRNPWNRGRSYKGVDSRSRLDEEGDVPMSNESTEPRRRTNPYDVGQRRQGRGGRSNHYKMSKARNSSSVPSVSNQGRDGWYKITVLYGSKLDKGFIIKSLHETMKVPFVPFQFLVEGKNAYFFVETYQVAQAIERAANTILTPSGFKMKVSINPSHPPPISLSEDVLEKIKLTMSKRYNAETNRLDLTAFHQDPELKSYGIYAALQRSSLLVNVVKIIEDNIPQLQILDLSKNKIRELDSLKSLGQRIRGIRSLFLGGNLVRSMADLDHLKDMLLEELVLDGNPLCDHFREQTAYIR